MYIYVYNYIRPWQDCGLDCKHLREKLEAGGTVLGGSRRSQRATGTSWGSRAPFHKVKFSLFARLQTFKNL